MNLDNFKEYYFLYRNKINMILISFVIIIIFIGGIILINYYNKNTSKETITDNEPIIKHTVEEKVIENESIYVDIKGSVINEGVYELEKGSRVIEKTTTNMIQKIKPIFTVNPLISKEI